MWASTAADSSYRVLPLSLGFMLRWHFVWMKPRQCVHVCVFVVWAGLPNRRGKSHSSHKATAGLQCKYLWLSYASQQYCKKMQGYCKVFTWVIAAFVWQIQELKPQPENVKSHVSHAGISRLPCSCSVIAKNHQKFKKKMCMLKILFDRQWHPCNLANLYDSL